MGHAAACLEHAAASSLCKITQGWFLVIQPVCDTLPCWELPSWHGKAAVCGCCSTVEPLPLTSSGKNGFGIFRVGDHQESWETPEPDRVGILVLLCPGLCLFQQIFFIEKLQLWRREKRQNAQVWWKHKIPLVTIFKSWRSSCTTKPSYHQQGAALGLQGRRSKGAYYFQPSYNYSLLIDDSHGEHPYGQKRTLFIAACMDVDTCSSGSLHFPLWKQWLFYCFYSQFYCI